MTVHVPPDLPRGGKCRLAFVGEAPGRDEIDPMRGEPRPFIGAAGWVFNSMLRTAGIDREDVLVTNVFDEKLPDNDVNNWCMTLAEKLKNPDYPKLPPVGRAGFLRPEHLWQLDRLRAELEAAKPTVIVPLGGTALWALTGDASIGLARGCALPATRLVPGTKLIPTYHPSYVQKNWKFYTICVGDYMKAIRETEFPDIRLRKRRLLLEPTLKEFRDYTNDVLLKADRVCNDIETGWNQITCIGFGPHAEEAMCVPFVDLRKPSKCYWETLDEEVEAVLLCKAILEAPMEKLGQNYGYDIYWLLQRWGIRPMNARHDTRLIHHALFPELPKNLGFLGACYDNGAPWKMMRSRGKGATEKRDD